MQSLFDKLYRKAERVITSDTALAALLDKVFLKIGESSEVFYRFQDNLLALVRMMRSWMSGAYRQISFRAIIAVVATLIYFVNPLDVIPDFIPVVGAIDDILILGYLIKMVNKEIERFITWEQTRQSQ